MSIAKQAIILCMLLYNNAGFTTLNLSNHLQGNLMEVDIQQSNQKQLSSIQQLQKQIPSREMLQIKSHINTQNRQESEDFIETNNNQNILIQLKQLQDAGQSQMLIGEDYQVIDYANPQELNTQASEESQNQSYQNTNSQINKGKTDSNNDQFKLNSQDEITSQQNAQNEEFTFDEEAGYMSDSPQDFELNNDSKDLNKSLNNSEQEGNQGQPLLKQEDDVANKENQQQKPNEIQKLNQGENEVEFKQNEGLINKQSSEESLQENQIMKSQLNGQDVADNQVSHINHESEMSHTQKMKVEQDEQLQDSLKVGYIIENNVETDDYLKDVQDAESNSLKQQSLQQKLEQEEQYLKQLKSNEQDDENKLKQLEEQKNLIYNQEQSEQQEIKQINKQIDIYEQKLQEIQSNSQNESNNQNTESKLEEQTQFRPYEGQDLIISSEVNYDEGNMEQFEYVENNQVIDEHVNNNQAIEEKAETLVLQDDEQNNNFNWNQNTQYQNTFGQSNYISNREKEDNDVQDFDQSVPAQPQEVSIDLNLKPSDLLAQINLSEDVLITATNEKSDLDQKPQDEENQILNFEDYNQQSNEADQNQILSINSQITLAQQINPEYVKQDQNVESENILVYQQQSYHEQIKEIHNDLSLYQMQQLIKRTSTNTNLRARGRIQDLLDVQQPSLLFQNNQKQPNDLNDDEDRNHSFLIDQNIQRYTEILNQSNQLATENKKGQQEMISMKNNNFPQRMEYENLQQTRN
ncbi:unnamed protein product (macronuclear) [Paramecium tetraurelia]|uniref:Uncharacterized protein n=1 Tax=Paramecium tetraurelia TaxID=5888 RepID=A0CMM4_PARTE|nr:uncharacterized protein GSPATT00008520001 [Paramecium tetraurelia]CAK72041.1 unnamed protein product [Paramecium tetraurelia]|eukprot:XP_001439438.1 hypothetical protein (macronuclear) [Paramecium tetraurelia strain d4-2]